VGIAERLAWGGFSTGRTIWGDIPSISVLENSMSDYEFETCLDGLFMHMSKGDNLILVRLRI
jgi:hypothetical protein